MRRFTIFLVAAGALLLLPAAQAFAGEHLHVNIQNVGGEGSGTVRSGPNAAEVAGEDFWGTSPYIECKGPPTASIGPGLCDTTMKEITGGGYEQVFLRAEPGPHSVFVEWTVQHGAFEQCEANIACMPYVEPSGSGGNNSEVTAIFACEAPGACVAGPPLTVKIEEGSGTVTSTPAGLSCTGSAPHECTTEGVPAGAVSLVATPASGYVFGSWSGCTTHIGLTCGLTLSAESKPVKVKFVRTPSLTIEKAGSGIGKISASAISCDENCSVATSEVKAGTAVTVKAAPVKGSSGPVFEGGTGSASGCSGETCTFTLSADSSVKVKFTAKPTKTLTLDLTGPGANKGKVTGKATVPGLVKSSFSCGSGCLTTSESFFSSDEIELIATPSTGYTFAGWKVEGGEANGCTGTTSPCHLLTNANKTVKAEFK